MATYYVSATTGNDSSAGTAVGTAVATIGAAENKATTAGDIVYIAPGTYRETVTHGYSGTAANRIYFIGDPDCEIFTDIIPGIVRITTTDVNNFGTDTAYVVNSNGKDYITWKNIYVDGGTCKTSYSDSNTTYGFRCSVETDYMEVINCMAQCLYYGTYRVAYVRDSVMTSYYYAIREGLEIDRCVVLGAYVGVFSANLVRNCVAYGSTMAFYNNDKVINCTGMGSSAFRNYNGDYVYDSVAMYSSYGFYGGYNTNASQNGTHSSSYAHNCNYVSNYGKMHGLKYGSTRILWLNNRDPLVGKNGSTDMQGDGLMYDSASFNLHSINNVRKLRDVLNPTLLSTAIQGSTVTDGDGDAGALDILGNPRIMGSKRGIYVENASGFTTSSRDLGAYECLNKEVTGSYSGSMPAFKISDEGIFRIPIAISASTAITASIHVKHNSGSATQVLKKPKFELRYSETNVTASVTSGNTTTAANKHLTGSALLIQSERSTADNENWQKLTVSHSAVKNRELELLFINAMSGSTTSSFSHLEIT